MKTRMLLTAATVMILALGGACAAEEDTIVPADPISEVDPTSATAMDTSTVAATDGGWGDWAEWDADRNDSLARTEFDTRFDTVFATWDVDRNQSVSRDELADTWYDAWDGNDDNIIDETEWNRGAQAWNFDGVDLRSWRDWDADNDGRLLETEFREGFQPVYDVWDADRNNAVTTDELRDTWWDLFDRNDDNMVDGDEWRTATFA